MRTDVFAASVLVSILAAPAAFADEPAPGPRAESAFDEPTPAPPTSREHDLGVGLTVVGGIALTASSVGTVLAFLLGSTSSCDIGPCPAPSGARAAFVAGDIASAGILATGIALIVDGNAKTHRASTALVRPTRDGVAFVF